jgi:hypothetical protein
MPSSYNGTLPYPVTMANHRYSRDCGAKF